MSDLRAELTAIRKKHRKLTPAIVVKVAADPKHPLHSRFEWDDTVAARKYRLDQARELIGLVRVSYTNAEGEAKTVRGFHAVRASDSDQYDYEPIEEVMADPFKRKIVLQDMQRQISELITRYESFDEFWTVMRKAVRRKKAS